MKPFVRFTSLVLAVLFLAGAAFAWTDLLSRQGLLSDPLLKPAAGLLTTGLVFLGLGLRGWRPRRRDETAKTVHLRDL
jgi:hypothetical protein